MTGADIANDPVLRALVEGLREALGPRLKSVVLYGSAARGDHVAGKSDLNVVIVLESFDPAALEALAPSARRFVRRGHQVPKMFTPALIAASADAFPIEFADIREARVVLHGDDPFGKIAVGRDHLRLQLEREIKEKSMRLREAYLLVHDRPAALRRLLRSSYPVFVALFRGALHMIGRPVPSRSHEVVAAFCEATGVDGTPFEEVARLRRGEKGSSRDPRTIFARYHDALAGAAERVDRLGVSGGGTR